MADDDRATAALVAKRFCTCGCGMRATADYWHAWQAGRARGWNESYGRPYWWMRLRYLASEARFRVAQGAHRG